MKKAATMVGFPVEQLEVLKKQEEVSRRINRRRKFYLFLVFFC
jgi:hypothetical protein